MVGLLDQFKRIIRITDKESAQKRGNQPHLLVIPRQWQHIMCVRIGLNVAVDVRKLAASGNLVIMATSVYTDDAPNDEGKPEI